MNIQSRSIVGGSNGKGKGQALEQALRRSSRGIFDAWQPFIKAQEEKRAAAIATTAHLPVD